MYFTIYAIDYNYYVLYTNTYDVYIIRALCCVP